MFKAVLLTLILLMGDTRWRIRHDAQMSLMPYVPLILAELHDAEANGVNPEQSRRASWLLSWHYQHDADRLSRLLVDLPPIDCLTPDALRTDQQAVWEWMTFWRDRARVSLCAEPPDGAQWQRTGEDWERDWRLCDAPEVLAEATRLLCRRWIAARKDTAPLLESMRLELERRAQMPPAKENDP